MNILGYSYDADHHCEACTLAAHGVNGTLPDDAEDSEGNEIHAIFATDEWYETSIRTRQVLVCADCGAELDSIGADEATADEIEEFVSAYIACALWSSTDESDESGGRPLDENYSADDIADEADTAIRTDCEDFIAANIDNLRAAQALMVGFHTGDGSGNLVKRYRPSGYSFAQAGHDFWLTRNGHGAGFWDRGLGSVGDRLAVAARFYGEENLYAGDDGQLYV